MHKSYSRKSVINLITPKCADNRRQIYVTLLQCLSTTYMLNRFFIYREEKNAEENFQEEKSESFSYTASKSALKAFEIQMEKRKIVISMKKYLHRITY